MQQKSNFAYFILSGVVALGLTPPIVCVDAQAQAQIVFVSNRDERNWEVYVMEVDGQNPRNLTKNHHSDWIPSWSPNSKHIAFASDRNGDMEIYVMEVDGGNPRKLTNNPTDDTLPAWSPDGDRIAFSSNRSGSYDIYVMEVDGGNPRRLTKNRRDNWHPSWSPDGKHIAFASDKNRNSVIYVMNADGRKLQNLTNHRDGDDTQPAWFDPAFTVVPAGKKFTMWGWFKQVVQ